MKSSFPGVELRGHGRIRISHVYSRFVVTSESGQSTQLYSEECLSHILVDRLVFHRNVPAAYAGPWPKMKGRAAISELMELLLVSARVCPFLKGFVIHQTAQVTTIILQGLTKVGIGESRATTRLVSRVLWRI